MNLRSQNTEASRTRQQLNQKISSERGSSPSSFAQLHRVQLCHARRPGCFGGPKVGYCRSHIQVPSRFVSLNAGADRDVCFIRGNYVDDCGVESSGMTQSVGVHLPRGWAGFILSKGFFWNVRLPRNNGLYHRIFSQGIRLYRICPLRFVHCWFDETC